MDLQEKLEQSLIPPRVLLSKFRLIDEHSRTSHAYLDPYYYPFYYHLGSTIQCKNLLEIGFGIGLASSCYVMGGGGQIENFLGFQERTDGYYSPRLGKANLGSVYKKNIDVYIGQLYDEPFQQKLSCFKWNMAFVNDDQSYDSLLFCLNVAWDHLDDNGWICVDHVSSSAVLRDFCLLKHREYQVFSTRYRTGLVQK